MCERGRVFFLRKVKKFEHEQHSFADSPQATPVEDGGEVEDAGGEERPDSAASKTVKKVTNQFNFSERASQTLNNPLRVGRSSLLSILHNG